MAVDRARRAIAANARGLEAVLLPTSEPESARRPTQEAMRANSSNERRTQSSIASPWK